jgi:hypothetical protein
MLLKTLQRGNSRPNQTLRCNAEGCDDSTREGKPYCPEHVGQNDYVRNLLNKLDAKEKEAEAVRKKGQRVIDNDSITLQEIVQDLNIHGPRTIARLCRDTQLEHDVLVGYIDRLEKEGRVKKFRTSRGNDSVKLVTPHRLYQATQSGRFSQVGKLTTSGRFKRMSSGRQTVVI